VIGPEHPATAVRLYMKPGCHLCEQVEVELAHLGRRYPHRLERVDISTEARLMQAYGERVPVLVIGGREYNAPLSAADIEQALREALRAPSGTQ
jgi:glutathione S-transferase